ncbi:MAG: DUF420 domain-containing protein [Polyangia bacterium]
MTPAAEASEGTKLPVAALIVVSGVAVAFLLWLLYVHEAPPEFASRLQFLPALNAVLNGCAALSLVVGFSLIRARNIRAHRNAMIVAFSFSTVFLLSYITHHALHGSTYYPGHSTMRSVYLVLLSSHVLLSVVALPLVLVTFFFSLTRRFPQHRRIARWTFPLWLYVSVTGVVVYLMLAHPVL